MNYSIGGDFEITYEDLSQGKIKQCVDEEINTIYTDTGRSALYLALQAILQNGGKKEAWLPGYCCSSVLLPFHQLGFKVNYYSMGKNLQTTMELPTNLNRSTFLFIHYFGKKNNEILNWLNEIQQQDANFIIEDCVQASLNDNVGWYGDFSIRSFRKFLPQPDGALLRCRQPFLGELYDSDEKFISKKIIGKILRGGKSEESEFLRLFAESEEQIDGTIIPRHMSWASRYLFAKADLTIVKQKRRDNWMYLQNLIKDNKVEGAILDSLYKNLELGEIPLGYPVVIKKGLRDQLRSFLISKKIFCPVHWPIDNNNLVIEQTLSSSILTLPIDQRLTREMLEYMIYAIVDFTKKR